MIAGLPEKLSKLRNQNNLSQREVARRTGIAQTSICQYETGARDPSLNSLIQLSHLYHCSIDYLLKGSSPENQIVIDRTTLSPAKYELLQSFLKSLDEV